MLLAFFALGCSSYGKMNDQEWEAPSSIVYDISSEDRLMIVFSDLPSLCAELTSGEEPNGYYWVLSLWTQNRAVEKGEYTAEGYFREVINETPHERIPTSATIDLSGILEGQRNGTYDAIFSAEEYLSGSFNAESCPGVYLFTGMEE